MSRSQKIAILMILAIICAVVSGFSIYTYCNTSKGFIYVFNDDYKAGTKISKEMFSSIKVDKKIVVDGQKGGLETYYITDENFSKVVKNNEFLLNDVIKDQPFTFVDLAYTSGTSIERSLSGDGMAVTIPISGSAAVTDDLRVGSVVNIYSSDSFETSLLFENMKIIARNEGDSISTVTFETNPDDTLDLINAANNYHLYFSLVQPVINESQHSGYVEQKEENIPERIPENEIPE